MSNKGATYMAAYLSGVILGTIIMAIILAQPELFVLVLIPLGGILIYDLDRQSIKNKKDSPFEAKEANKDEDN